MAFFTQFSMREQELEKNIYKRVLRWAAMRGSEGFKIEQLREVAGSDKNFEWIKRFMFGHINGDIPLIGNDLLAGGEEHTYYLTGHGAIAASNYSDSLETRKSSMLGLRVAAGAFFLAAIVGAIQICLTIEQIKLQKQQMNQAPLEQISDSKG